MATYTYIHKAIMARSGSNFKHEEHIYLFIYIEKNKYI